MYKLKLAYVLPVLFCGVGGFLWYWHLHTPLMIPRSMESAALILLGLEFPMCIVAAAILAPFRDSLPSQFPLLTGLLLVAPFWYLIGTWLDRRSEVNFPSKPKGLLFTVVFRALVLAFGVFALWLSFDFHRDIYYVVQSIGIALMQTWAVFLIGIPAVGIVRHFLDKQASFLFTPSARGRISNFRLFELIVGVFALLVLLWLPPGPLLPQGFHRAVLQLLGR